MTNFSTRDLVDLANGKCQLEDDLDWGSLFCDSSIVSSLKNYSLAHNTELEFILVPFFVMCGATVGNQANIHCGTVTPGRSNQYLLMSGSPASGKSSGFHKSVLGPAEAIESELGFSVLSQDLSRSALLAALQKQTEQRQRFLIIASDEMGLWLNGESKDTKEWEKKRALYNSCFTGTNIIAERMKGRKPMKLKIDNPHLTILGMTQPKPLFEWIKNVSNDDDGLLDRYLVWVVKQTEKRFVSDCEINLPKDWPKQALQIVASYHESNPTKQYIVPANLYEKVYELENMKTRSSMTAWNRFLQVLASGDETAAILLRRNDRTSPLIRFAELVMRFSIGLHVGLYGFRHCLSNLPLVLDSIPEILDEYVIEFATIAVQRCARQVQHFKNAANKISRLREPTNATKVSTCELKTSACSAVNESKKVQCKPGSGMSITTASESNKATSKLLDYSHIEPSVANNADKNLPDERKVGRPRKKLQTPDDLQLSAMGAIATFPSKYVVPKAIYRWGKGITSKQVQKLFREIGSIQHGKGFLGKVIKVKSNPKARRSMKVLFRAPYNKVDQKLLQQFHIDNEQKYRSLLDTEIGGSGCQLKRVIENDRWTDFLVACQDNIPDFFDVPDFN